MRKLIIIVLSTLLLFPSIAIAQASTNDVPLEEKERVIFVLKNGYEEKIPMTVLTMDEAKKLFDYYKSQPQYAWKWPDDCQESRAMVIARDLESHGIIVGKEIALGDLSLATKNNPHGYVRKYNDEAIAVIVEIDGVKTEYIIDPTFFDKIVIGRDWFSWVNNEGSDIQDADVFSRFTYFFKDGGDNKVSAKAYDPKQVQDAHNNLKKCKEFEDKRFPPENKAGN